MSALVDRLAREQTDGARVVMVEIHDMRCASCGARIRAALEPGDGILDVRLDAVRRTAAISFDAALTTPIAILDAIERAGYTATFTGAVATDPDFVRARRMELKRLGVAGIAMMQVMMFAFGSYAGAFAGIEPAYDALMRWSGLVFSLPVVFFCARPFFSNAAASIAAFGNASTSSRSSFAPGAAHGARRPGLAMDVPVSIGIAAAFVASVHATFTAAGEVYFDSITMLTFFLLSARFLEQRVRHSMVGLDHWLALLPRSVWRRDASGGAPVPLDEIRVGDRVVVPAGSRIAFDGTIVEGASSIDEATLTGESSAVEKALGATVFAGTMNLAQPIVVRVSHVRADSRIAAIERLAARATQERGALVTLTDRLAQRFVVALLVFAAVTAAVWCWIDASHAFAATLAVLVVSCPCALSLATPAAIAAATAALRRRGFVVTRANVLERLAGADVIVFDKTGTLTLGRPEIVRTTPLESLPASRCVAIAAALEAGANHPLRHAFLEAAGGTVTPSVRDALTHAGAGVEGTIDGARYRLGSASFCGLGEPADADNSIFLVRDALPVAAFSLRDRLHADAARTVAALERLGLEVLAISGDAPRACRDVADVLGIPVQSRVSPESKLDHIVALTRDGRRAVMIGDGLNDVPGLSAATVAIAPLAATDVACDAADALLLSRGLATLADAFTIARRTMVVVRQNLAWAFSYNLVCLPLAAAGLLPAWLAALGMSASSLLVTLNALRLARPRRAVVEA